MPPLGPPDPNAPTDPLAWLQSLPEPPALRMGIAARNLTQEQARDIIVYLVGQGELRLDPVPTQAGGVIRPRPNERIKISPNVVAGITYAPASAGYIDNLDMRMAVVLYRLAKLLKSQFSASQIQHMGIGHGRGDSGDCHNTGRALDFAGMTDNAGNTYSVFTDWGSRPIPGHHGSSVWPATERAPTYRLTAADGRPFFLFQAVYQFATGECQDRSQDPDPGGWVPTPTTIGQASFICHPDHIDARLRMAHQNHIHMQIGHTFS